MQKKCTVVMPLYNKEKYLKQAIESVLSQTALPSIELVIADDCSTDSSLEIALSFAKQYPDTVKVLSSSENRGLLANDLRVFRDMHTPFFCVLDPDDYWIDNSFVEKAITFLETYPPFSCYSSNTVIQQEGKPNQSFLGDSIPEYITNSINDYLASKALIPHTTASVYRNSIFANGIPKQIEESIGTVAEASFRGDHDRFVMHLKYGKAYFKNEYVGVYRWTSEGIWASASALHQDLLNLRALFDYSEFYDNVLEEEFYNLAEPKYLLVKDKIRSAYLSGVTIPDRDMRIFNSIKELIEPFIESKAAKEQFTKLQLSVQREATTQAEILWATIFHDTIKGSSWFTNNMTLSPGRWALGYPGLYALYRILDEVNPTSILEMGLGQSTRIIGEYVNYYSKQYEGTVEHYVTEHDSSWIDFWKNKNESIHPDIVQLDMAEVALEVEDGRKTPVNMYLGFSEKFDGKKFDLIFIDAPLGSDEYSRMDILGILPECLKDNWVIIMDDAERIGERSTLCLIFDILKTNSIPYKTGLYSGEKCTYIITSEDYSFLTTM